MGYNIEVTCSFVLVAHTIQFSMKLEEKMHTKEDEMSKIQARKQVKKLFNYYLLYIMLNYSTISVWDALVC